MSVIKINIFNLLYSLMIYLPEDFYFKNVQDFPCQKAILVTAKTIARWCDSYEARILEPKRGVKVKQRFGDLPKNTNDREKLTEEILNWIWDNSTGLITFSLYIKKSIGNEYKNIFDHHDDSCCWFIDLTNEQFNELKQSWKNHDLPEDLFFQEDQAIVTNIKADNQFLKIKKFLFGGSYSFSPRVWNNMLKTGKAKNFQILNQKTLSNHD